MNATTEQVFIDALSLPTKVRAELAHKLLASLEQEAGSPEIEAAWKQEVVERCIASDQGQLSEREAADVLREAYREIK